jgi:NAD(P)-dependent dehydrogenase (short-subunit alcohol dehydrogenase family)
MDLMFDLTGHAALVTGGSSGIGKHVAEVLARHGATVAVAARRVDKLEATAAVIRERGGKAVTVAMDVAKGASIVAAIEEVEKAVGTIDMLINNAGIVGTKSAVDTDEEEWDAVLDTNLKGAWLCAREVARRLIAQSKPGSIVNVASILGLITQKGTAPYSASKAGLIHLTRILASEWVRYGIRVNSVAPGYIVTDMTENFFATPRGEKVIQLIPQRRVGTVEDLTAPILLLASSASAYMTGAVIPVDGGISLGNY